MELDQSVLELQKISANHDCNIELLSQEVYSLRCFHPMLKWFSIAAKIFCVCFCHLLHFFILLSARPPGMSIVEKGDIASDIRVSMPSRPSSEEWGRRKHEEEPR
jgi:hypothetical protein